MILTAVALAAGLLIAGVIAPNPGSGRRRGGYGGTGETGRVPRADDERSGTAGGISGRTLGRMP
jgi:hypothetical protein